MERLNLGKSCVPVELDNFLYAIVAMSHNLSYPQVTSCLDNPATVGAHRGA